MIRLIAAIVLELWKVRRTRVTYAPSHDARRTRSRIALIVAIRYVCTVHSVTRW